MLKLLIVEDEPDIARNLAEYINAVEPTFRPVLCEDGFKAFSIAATDPDVGLALIDIGLPVMDGISLCRRLRTIGWTRPIILVSARDTEADKIQGLEAGADDYVVKPFSLAEVMARVRAQLRRADISSPQTVLRAGPITLNLQTREASRSGVALKLNATTFGILALLVKNSPGVVTQQELIDALWPEQTPSAETLRSHIYMLRCVVDKPFDSPLIKTLPGIGWKIS